MKALVTGGAGLIGSHLVDLLIGQGVDVTILDNLEPETHPGGPPAWIPAKARFIRGDVRDKEALARALDGADCVFHEAAYGGFSPLIEKYVDVNSLGTARLFDVIREKKFPVRKIVVASSQAVYGEGKYRCAKDGVRFPGLRSVAQLSKGNWEQLCPECGGALEPLPTDESKPVDPGSLYSLTKYDEEKIGLLLGRQFGIPTTALRYGVTYGPRQSLFN